MDFTFLKSCADLTEDHFAEAAETREDAYEFLLRLADISQPHNGTSTTILRFLSRVAIASRWVDGDVRIRIDFAGVFRTRLVFMRNLGGDEYEVLKRIELAISFMEFRETCKEAKAIRPFIVTATRSAGQDMHITLDAPEQIRRSSIPPPGFIEAQARLAEKLRPPPMPRLKPEIAAALEKIHRLRNASEVDQESPPPLPITTPIARIKLTKRTPSMRQNDVQPATDRNPESLLPLIRPTEHQQAPDSARKRTLAYGAPAAEKPATTPRPDQADDIDDGWDDG
ncbi:MAG: hypothetical protein RDU25_04960 [Patescibacteria group bacterium]|nr:hypothetical protein [Patescibacteria group bacterium]